MTIQEAAKAAALANIAVSINTFDGGMSIVLSPMAGFVPRATYSVQWGEEDKAVALINSFVDEHGWVNREDDPRVQNVLPYRVEY